MAYWLWVFFTGCAIAFASSLLFGPPHPQDNKFAALALICALVAIALK